MRSGEPHSATILDGERAGGLVQDSAVEAEEVPE